MSKLRKKKYTKNSNKIHKHKIKKSLKRGQIYFPSFNLGRKHIANTLTKYRYRGGGEADVQEELQPAANEARDEARSDTHEAIDEAQLDANEAIDEPQPALVEVTDEVKKLVKEYLQEIRRDIYDEVNVPVKAGYGKFINYQDTESLLDFVRNNRTLSVDQKSYMIKTLTTVIKRVTKELEDNQRELIKILSASIKKKKELLKQYDKSCKTSPRPSSKFGFASRLVYSNKTRIKELEDEITVLNECIKLHALKSEGNDQLKSLSTQNKKKVEILTCEIIISAIREDLRIVRTIQDVYVYPTVSHNEKSTHEPYGNSNEQTIGYDETSGHDVGSDAWRRSGGNSGSGGYQKRRTKRHMLNNKRRHTKKRN